MILRDYNLLELLKLDQSIFVLGPRGCGKSTYIRKTLIENFMPEDCHEFDLLSSDSYSKYIKRPSHFAEEVEYILKKSPTPTQIIFVDEIQKVPLLLDEVHRLIEYYKQRVVFVISGSSARKLKKSGANLLAGRAVSLRISGFSSNELNEQFDLTEALQWGALPLIWNKSNEQKSLILKTYIDTYLREEILQESILRNIESFTLFLELAGQLNGETINYSKIAVQCHLNSATVKEYFQILSDTLIGQIVPSWGRSVKKQIVMAPRFYFFDIGVINALNGDLLSEVKYNSNRAGKLFETFIINEITKLIFQKNLNFKLYHWRTKEGQEVDLILAKNAFSKPLAFEIKSSDTIYEDDIKHLHVFKKEEPTAELFCICRTERPYMIKDVQILPWKLALKEILTLA